MTHLRKNKSEYPLVLSLVMLVLTALTLHAQTTASITGTVFDSSGAIVPDAHVILTEQSSQDRRELNSNSSAFFNFAGIKPGTYTVNVSATGFQKLEEKGIVVNPGDTRNLSNLALTV